jgi:hypothetical protein
LKEKQEAINARKDELFEVREEEFEDNEQSFAYERKLQLL